MRVEIAARCGNEVGESVLWDSEREEVLWVDIERGSLLRLEPGSGRCTARSLMIESVPSAYEKVAAWSSVWHPGSRCLTRLMAPGASADGRIRSADHAAQRRARSPLRPIYLRRHG